MSGTNRGIWTYNIDWHNNGTNINSNDDGDDDDDDYNDDDDVDVGGDVCYIHSSK